jgi:hypothetical protein
MRIAPSIPALHLSSNSKHNTAARRPPMAPQPCSWRRPRLPLQLQQPTARVQRTRAFHFLAAAAHQVLPLPLPQAPVAALPHTLPLTCLAFWRLALFSSFECAWEGTTRGSHDSVGVVRKKLVLLLKYTTTRPNIYNNP